MRSYETLDKPEVLEFASSRQTGIFQTIKRHIRRFLGYAPETDTRLLGVPVRVGVHHDKDGYLLRQYYRNRPFDLKLVYAGSDFVLSDAKVVAMARTSENHCYYYIRYQGIKP